MTSSYQLTEKEAAIIEAYRLHGDEEKFFIECAAQSIMDCQNVHPPTAKIIEFTDHRKD